MITSFFKPKGDEAAAESSSAPRSAAPKRHKPDDAADPSAAADETGTPSEPTIGVKGARRSLGARTRAASRAQAFFSCPWWLSALV